MNRPVGTLSRPAVAAMAVVPVVFVSVLFAWPVATVLARGLHWQVVTDVLTNPGIRSVIWFTLWQALASTALTLLAGLGPAYVFARFRFPGRRLALATVTVPFVLPTVVVGAAFLALLPTSLHHTVWAILLAHVFFNLAVVVRLVGGLWEQLDPDLAGAARTLGAGPVRAFVAVTLPLLRPALAAAGSIVFLFTFTSYGVIRVLGGPRLTTVEVEVYLRAVQLGDLPGACALALLQLVAMAAVLWWSGRLQERAAQGGLHLQAAARRRARSARETALVIAVVGTTLAAVLIPLVALVLRSFRVGEELSLAGWRGLGGAELRPGVSVGADPISALATSLRFATVAALIAVVVGTASAVAIAGAGRGGRLLDAGLMLPLGTSAVTIGLGILITFDQPPVDFRASTALIPLVHALVAVPFVVRAVLPVLRSIPAGLREAASALGAAPWRVWCHVELPIASRAIVAGAGFAFAVSLGEFGATSFLTRRGNETLPIAVQRLLGRTGDVLQASGYALATILLLSTIVAVVAVDALRPERSGVI
jgi:thiamine transport system permease protein